jgi:menaquinone-9 beta-reductase
VRARWVVGADGAASRVRGWAKLDHATRAPAEQRTALRFPAPLPRRALDRLHGTALGPPLPGLCHAGQPRRSWCGADLVQSEVAAGRSARGISGTLARLKDAELASSERGAITVTRRLRRVYRRPHGALVGDASGGVDAITGEGLCLAFRQADSPRRLSGERRPRSLSKGSSRAAPPSRLMARMMLLMAKHRPSAARTHAGIPDEPSLFCWECWPCTWAKARRDCISNGIALGWELLTPFLSLRRLFPPAPRSVQWTVLADSQLAAGIPRA